MKERYDPKTQDIFLILTSDELEALLGVGGIEGLKLTSHEKKVNFSLFRDPISDNFDNRYIEVSSAYDVPGRYGPDYTNFVIYLGKRACDDLRMIGICEDRYMGVIGAEKVHIVIEELEDPTDKI